VRGFSTKFDKFSVGFTSVISEASFTSFSYLGLITKPIPKMVSVKPTIIKIIPNIFFEVFIKETIDNKEILPILRF